MARGDLRRRSRNRSGPKISNCDLRLLRPRQHRPRRRASKPRDELAPSHPSLPNNGGRVAPQSLGRQYFEPGTGQHCFALYLSQYPAPSPSRLSRAARRCEGANEPVPRWPRLRRFDTSADERGGTRRAVSSEHPFYTGDPKSACVGTLRLYSRPGDGGSPLGPAKSGSSRAAQCTQAIFAVHSISPICGKDGAWQCEARPQVYFI
jgi:hypothetical protein